MKFDDIIGNANIKEYLQKSIKDNNIVHSYLFLGTAGIGKKLIAKEFAKKVLCLDGDNQENCVCKSCVSFEGQNNPDYIEVIPDSKKDIISVDMIRDLLEKISIKPIVSNKKVIIIDDFDKTRREGQNALLKTLEEPPEYVTIILIASNENSIINTIKSRCMTLKFKNIEDDVLLKYAKENLGYTEVSKNLLKTFDGSISKAIKLKNNKEKYSKIDELVNLFSKNTYIEIQKIGKLIFDKENIYDMLDYLIVSLFSMKQMNEKYIDAIQYVNKCVIRLEASCNFEMCIDNMLLEIWEEIN